MHSLIYYVQQLQLGNYEAYKLEVQFINPSIREMCFRKLRKKVAFASYSYHKAYYL